MELKWSDVLDGSVCEGASAGMFDSSYRLQLRTLGGRLVGIKISGSGFGRSDFQALMQVRQALRRRYLVAATPLVLSVPLLIDALLHISVSVNAACQAVEAGVEEHWAGRHSVPLPDAFFQWPADIFSDVRRGEDHTAEQMVDIERRLRACEVSLAKYAKDGLRDVSSPAETLRQAVAMQRELHRRCQSDANIDRDVMDRFLDGAFALKKGVLTAWRRWLRNSYQAMPPPRCIQCFVDYWGTCTAAGPQFSAYARRPSFIASRCFNPDWLCCLLRRQIGVAGMRRLESSRVAARQVAAEHGVPAAGDGRAGVARPPLAPRGAGCSVHSSNRICPALLRRHSRQQPRPPLATVARPAAAGRRHDGC